MNVLSSDSASVKLGKTTMAERPIVTESNKIIRLERVIFMLKNLKFLYLNLP